MKKRLLGSRILSGILTVAMLFTMAPTTLTSFAAEAEPEGEVTIVDDSAAAEAVSSDDAEAPAENASAADAEAPAEDEVGVAAEEGAAEAASEEVQGSVLEDEDQEADQFDSYKDSELALLSTASAGYYPDGGENGTYPLMKFFAIENTSTGDTTVGKTISDSNVSADGTKITRDGVSFNSYYGYTFYAVPLAGYTWAKNEDGTDKVPVKLAGSYKNGESVISVSGADLEVASAILGETSEKDVLDANGSSLLNAMSTSGSDAIGLYSWNDGKKITIKGIKDEVEGGYTPFLKGYIEAENGRTGYSITKVLQVEALPGTVVPKEDVEINIYSRSGTATVSSPNAMTLMGTTEVKYGAPIDIDVAEVVKDYMSENKKTWADYSDISLEVLTWDEKGKARAVDAEQNIALTKKSAPLTPTEKQADNVANYYIDQAGRTVSIGAGTAIKAYAFPEIGHRTISIVLKTQDTNTVTVGGTITTGSGSTIAYHGNTRARIELADADKQFGSADNNKDKDESIKYIKLYTTEAAEGENARSTAIITEDKNRNDRSLALSDNKINVLYSYNAKTGNNADNVTVTENRKYVATGWDTDQNKKATDLKDVDYFIIPKGPGDITITPYSLETVRINDGFYVSGTQQANSIDDVYLYDATDEDIDTVLSYYPILTSATPNYLNETIGQEKLAIEQDWASTPAKYKDLLVETDSEAYLHIIPATNCWINGVSVNYYDAAGNLKETVALEKDENNNYYLGKISGFVEVNVDGQKNNTGRVVSKSNVDNYAENVTLLDLITETKIDEKGATLAKAGEDYTFKAVVNPGYEISSMTVEADGTAVTPSVSGTGHTLYYTVPAASVTGNLEIKVGARRIVTINKVKNPYATVVLNSEDLEANTILKDSQDADVTGYKNVTVSIKTSSGVSVAKGDVTKADNSTDTTKRLYLVFDKANNSVSTGNMGAYDKLTYAKLKSVVSNGDALVIEEDSTAPGNYEIPQSKLEIGTGYYLYVVTNRDVTEGDALSATFRDVTDDPTKTGEIITEDTLYAGGISTAPNGNTPAGRVFGGVGQYTAVLNIRNEDGTTTRVTGYDGKTTGNEAETPVGDYVGVRSWALVSADGKKSATVSDGDFKAYMTLNGVTSPTVSSGNVVRTGAAGDPEYRGGQSSALLQAIFKRTDEFPHTTTYKAGLPISIKPLKDFYDEIELHIESHASATYATLSPQVKPGVIRNGSTSISGGDTAFADVRVYKADSVSFSDVGGKELTGANASVSAGNAVTWTLSATGMTSSDYKLRHGATINAATTNVSGTNNKSVSDYAISISDGNTPQTIKLSAKVTFADKSTKTLPGEIKVIDANYGYVAVPTSTVGATTTTHLGYGVSGSDVEPIGIETGREALNTANITYQVYHIENKDETSYLIDYLNTVSGSNYTISTSDAAAIAAWKKLLSEAVADGDVKTISNGDEANDFLNADRKAVLEAIADAGYLTPVAASRITWDGYGKGQLYVANSTNANFVDISGENGTYAITAKKNGGKDIRFKLDATYGDFNVVGIPYRVNTNERLAASTVTIVTYDSGSNKYRYPVLKDNVKSVTDSAYTDEWLTNAEFSGTNYNKDPYMPSSNTAMIKGNEGGIELTSAQKEKDKIRLGVVMQDIPMGAKITLPGKDDFESTATSGSTAIDPQRTLYGWTVSDSNAKGYKNIGETIKITKDTVIEAVWAYKYAGLDKDSKLSPGSFEVINGNTLKKQEDGTYTGERLNTNQPIAYENEVPLYAGYYKLDTDTFSDVQKAGGTINSVSNGSYGYDPANKKKNLTVLSENSAVRVRMNESAAKYFHDKDYTTTGEYEGPAVLKGAQEVSGGNASSTSTIRVDWKPAVGETYTKEITGLTVKKISFVWNLKAGGEDTLNLQVGQKKKTAATAIITGGSISDSDNGFTVSGGNVTPPYTYKNQIDVKFLGGAEYNGSVSSNGNFTISSGSVSGGSTIASYEWFVSDDIGSNDEKARNKIVASANPLVELKDESDDTGNFVNVKAVGMKSTDTTQSTQYLYLRVKDVFGNVATSPSTTIVIKPADYHIDVKVTPVVLDKDSAKIGGTNGKGVSLASDATTADVAVGANKLELSLVKNTATVADAGVTEWIVKTTKAAKNGIYSVSDGETVSTISSGDGNVNTWGTITPNAIGTGKLTIAATISGGNGARVERTIDLTSYANVAVYGLRNNETNTYTLSYKGTGIGKDTILYLPVKSTNYNSNTKVYTVSLSDLTVTPTDSAKEFAGWKTASNGDVAVYEPGETLSLKAGNLEKPYAVYAHLEDKDITITPARTAVTLTDAKPSFGTISKGDGSSNASDYTWINVNVTPASNQRVYVSASDGTKLDIADGVSNSDAKGMAGKADTLNPTKADAANRWNDGIEVRLTPGTANTTTNARVDKLGIAKAEGEVGYVTVYLRGENDKEADAKSIEVTLNGEYEGSDGEKYYWENGKNIQSEYRTVSSSDHYYDESGVLVSESIWYAGNNTYYLIHQTPDRRGSNNGKMDGGSSMPTTANERVTVEGLYDMQVEKDDGSKDYYTFYVDSRGELVMGRIAQYGKNDPRYFNSLGEMIVHTDPRVDAYGVYKDEGTNVSYYIDPKTDEATELGLYELTKTTWTDWEKPKYIEQTPAIGVTFTYTATKAGTSVEDERLKSEVKVTNKEETVVDEVAGVKKIVWEASALPTYAKKAGEEPVAETTTVEYLYDKDGKLLDEEPATYYYAGTHSFTWEGGEKWNTTSDAPSVTSSFTYVSSEAGADPLTRNEPVSVTKVQDIASATKEDGTLDYNLVLYEANAMAAYAKSGETEKTTEKEQKVFDTVTKTESNWTYKSADWTNWKYDLETKKATVDVAITYDVLQGAETTPTSRTISQSNVEAEADGAASGKFQKFTAKVKTVDGQEITKSTTFNTETGEEGTYTYASHVWKNWKYDLETKKATADVDITYNVTVGETTKTDTISVSDVEAKADGVSSGNIQKFTASVDTVDGKTLTDSRTFNLETGKEQSYVYKSHEFTWPRTVDSTTGKPVVTAKVTYTVTTDGVAAEETVDAIVTVDDGVDDPKHSGNKIYTASFVTLEIPAQTKSEEKSYNASGKAAGETGESGTTPSEPEQSADSKGAWNLFYTDYYGDTNGFPIELPDGADVTKVDSKAKWPTYYKVEGGYVTVIAKTPADLKKAASAANSLITIPVFGTDDTGATVQTGTFEYQLPVSYVKPSLKLTSTSGTVNTELKEEGSTTTTPQVLKTTVLEKKSTGAFEPLDITDQLESVALYNAKDSTAASGEAGTETGEIDITATNKTSGKIEIQLKNWAEKIAVSYNVKAVKKNVLTVSAKDIIFNDSITDGSGGDQTVTLSVNGATDYSTDAIEVVMPTKWSDSNIEVDGITDGKLTSSTLTFSYKSGAAPKKGNYAFTFKTSDKANVKFTVKVVKMELKKSITLKQQAKLNLVTGQKMVLIPTLKGVGGPITDAAFDANEKEFTAEYNEELGQIIVGVADGANVSSQNYNKTLTITAGGIDCPIDVKFKPATTTPTVKLGKVTLPKSKIIAGTAEGEASLLSTYKQGGKTFTIAPAAVKFTDGQAVEGEDGWFNITKSNVKVHYDEEKRAIEVKAIANQKGKVGSVKVELTYTGLAKAKKATLSFKVDSRN